MMAGEVQSDAESDGQWDVLSACGCSDPESDQNVVCREDLSQAEVNPDHFRCPPSPTLGHVARQVWHELASEQGQETYLQNLKSLDSFDIHEERMKSQHLRLHLDPCDILQEKEKVHHLRWPLDSSDFLEESKNVKHSRLPLESGDFHEEIKKEVIGAQQVWHELCSEQAQDNCSLKRSPLDSCDLGQEIRKEREKAESLAVAGASSEVAGMHGFQEGEILQEQINCRFNFSPLISSAVGGALFQVGKDLGFRLEFQSNLELNYASMVPFEQHELMSLLAQGKENLNEEGKQIIAEQEALLVKCKSYEKLKCDEEEGLLAQPSTTNERDCESWCVREAQLWRAQARHINPFWSIALAAALMGLLILGHKWQQERHQNQQLQLQLCDKDEKISQLMVQVTKLKHALSTRHHHVPVCPGKVCYHGLHDCF